jgi:amino acid permease
METMGADAFLLLTIWCLLGFIFYLITVARSGKTRAMGASAAGLTLFALLLFSALMWLGKRLMAAESLEAVHSILTLEGPITLVVIFIGLALSLQIQRLLRRNGAKVPARNPAGAPETNAPGAGQSPDEKRN